MKEKLIIFSLGIVLGVILAGGCFWFATTRTTATREMPEMDRTEMRQRPENNENMIANAIYE